MQYAELDQEEAVDTMGITELIGNIRDYFDVDEDHDEVDQEYVKTFEKFREEYTACMRQYLKAAKDFDGKSERRRTLENFLALLNDNYKDKAIELVDQFIQVEKLEETKKEMETLQKKVRIFYNTARYIKDLNVNDYLCYVCLERGISMYIEPCGHVLCKSCSEGTLQSCPFCRADINCFKKLLLG